MKDSSFFSVWPYVALALLVVGIAFRYLLVRRHPDQMATEVAEAKSVFAGKLFWGSLVLTIAAHLAGLLFPRVVLSWNTSPARLYILEGLAFAVGLVALATCAKIVWQHLGRSAGSWLTEMGDTIFLSLLFVVLVSGLLVAAMYRWGSSWGVMILTPYTVSVLRGAPASDLVEQLPLVVQLHVLATFAAVAIIPLTRLSTLLVSLLQICVALLTRPLTSAGAAAEAWVRKRNPSAWFWPEED